SAGALGDTITLTGLAFDFEDGDLTGGLRWTSSLDGLLGTGGSVTARLSRGVHTITATSVDAAGHVASKQIAVEVIARPTVIIALPANNALFRFGDGVLFSGFASDPADGTLTPSLTWTSNLDGVIGNGGSF